MEFTYILLIIILYYMVKKVRFDNSNEHFKSNEHLNNIFIDNSKKVNDYNILKLTKDETQSPILLTGYKFSEGYKLGFELSKIYPIKFTDSPSLFSNLETISTQGSVYQMCLCTENDIYEIMKQGFENLRIVCSFYRMEMIFILNAKFRIKTLDEIINLIKDNDADKKVIKLGILNTNFSSYYDAKKVLNCMNFNINIDIDKNKNKNNTEIYNKKGLRVTIYNSIQALIESFDKDNEDFIFLTTTSKNKYIIEYLKSNFITIIGIGNINSGLIQGNFDNIFKQKINLNKYNRIVKNDDTLFSYGSSEILGKQVYIDTYSTRLFLVARKELSEPYVYGLIESIYKNRIKLKENMNKYF